MDWNVYEDMSKDRMNKTMDLLISPDLQSKCYWNTVKTNWRMPSLKFRKNIIKIIQEISTTDWETVTESDVEMFVTKKLNLARRNLRRRGSGIREPMKSCDESSVELDDDTSIDCSSIDFGDDDDADGDKEQQHQQQQQEQKYEMEEEKLIEEELHTGNDRNEDDTSLDLDDDLDSIDDELDELEFD